jgi:hypothetical protein
MAKPKAPKKKAAKRPVAKKKPTAKKRAGTKRARTIGSADLRAAALRSVTAALGKPIKGGGILAGFITNQDELALLGKKPGALAREVALATSKIVGIPLEPGFIDDPRGGTLVGFVPPRINIR